jgi:hypothetical protein
LEESSKSNPLYALRWPFSWWRPHRAARVIHDHAHDEGLCMSSLRWPVLALGVLAVALWLLSYSWLLGLTPPTRWISREASPWWIAEVGAAAVGGLALVGGVLLGKRSGKIARWGAGLGAFALVMSVLGMTWLA